MHFEYYIHVTSKLLNTSFIHFISNKWRRVVVSTFVTVAPSSRFLVARVVRVQSFRKHQILITSVKLIRFQPTNTASHLGRKLPYTMKHIFCNVAFFLWPILSWIDSEFVRQLTLAWLSCGFHQGKSRGGSIGDGRLLIHLYYSAVTGNRKQVLTGRSESSEHKCR